jgi:hypothetical protein
MCLLLRIVETMEMNDAWKDLWIGTMTRAACAGALLVTGAEQPYLKGRCVGGRFP